MSAVPPVPPVEVVTETRPGYRTTEFWVAVLAFAAGVFQQAVGVFNISDQRVLWLQGILVSAYVISRGFAKSGVPDTVVVVPPAPAEPPLASLRGTSSTSGTASVTSGTATP